MVERSIQELHQDGAGEKASAGGQDESVGIDMKEQDFLDGASVEIFLEIYGLMEILSNLIWEFFGGLFRNRGHGIWIFFKEAMV